MPGCQVLALAVAVIAGLLLSAFVVCLDCLIALSLLATVRGGVVRSADECGRGFVGDSAGCSLGRFSHRWGSVWVSVCGERGVHTSVGLASTVLLGHP